MILNKLFGIINRPQKINEDALSITVKILQNGYPKEFDKILYQKNLSPIKYLPTVTEMLLKLKRPDTETLPLVIHKRLCRKKCSLLILDRQWFPKGSNYYPVLIQNSTSKVIGIMLPFNELH